MTSSLPSEYDAGGSLRSAGINIIVTVETHVAEYRPGCPRGVVRLSRTCQPKSVTRRVGAEPTGARCLKLGRRGLDDGISPRETLNRGGGLGLMTLCNKSLTESNIFQFV